MENAEICILETSNGFNRAGESKVSLDHYKPMFALLAMMKSTAYEYQYAAYDHFKKQIKFIFIHAHGTL